MLSKRWSRPNSVAHPTIWDEFTKTTPEGVELNFVIQDLTEDLYDPCIEHMKKYFIPDEPLYGALGMMNDELSREEVVNMWKSDIKERLTLVCLLKNKNTENNTISGIVGIQIQYYHHKSDDETSQEQFKGKALTEAFDVIHYLEAEADRYTSLHVIDYIDEHGLSVHPDYRRMGIATELLKSRCKLTKAVGLDTVTTVLSAVGSQKAAENAGYKLLKSIKYSELAKIFPNYNLKIQIPPSLAYMYIFVNEL